MKKMPFLMLVATLSISCTHSLFRAECNYSGIQGDEFLFSESSSKEQYRKFCKNIRDDYCGDALSYSQYVGKKGKYLETVTAKDVESYKGNRRHKVVLENCQELYLNAGQSYDETTFEQTTHYANLVLVKKVQQLNQSIGKQVWLSHQYFSGGKVDEFGKDTSIKFRHLDPVTVLAVITKASELKPHNFSAGSIYFKVQFPDKRIGIADVSLDYALHQQNPFKESWPLKVVEAIKDRSVFVGMTAEQAKLAWGKPQKINKTSTNRSVQEQWVYGLGQYLYIAGDRVTSVQHVAQ